MAELPAGFSRGAPSEKEMAQHQAREAAEEQRRVTLQGIMAPEARERLARVAIVKPENARAVEDHLLRLARSGKLSAKITEDDVIRILDEVSKQGGAGGAPVASKVTFTRKKRADDDDDDDDDF